jgi:hypothetical protein
MVEVAEKPMERVKVFGPTFPNNYPSEMRRQMWPLCCGASIVSGFKNTAKFSLEELVEEIEYVCKVPIPDFQIFAHEDFKPHMTFLTLNSEQMASQKLMQAIEKAKFVKIGEASPRYSSQGFFLRDTSNTWKAC